MIARALAISLSVALAVAFALGGCGSGSGSGSGSGGGVGVHGESSYIVPSSDPISSSERSGAAIPEWPGPNSNSGSPAQHGAGLKNDEVSATGAAPENPCRLVTRGEAAAILGEPVQTEVGPQGPACIYQPSGSQPQMTVVVERTDLAGLATRLPGDTDRGRGRVRMVPWLRLPIGRGSTGRRGPAPRHRALRARRTLRRERTRSRLARPITAAGIIPGVG